MGLEGTSFGQVEMIAYGDHWGPGSVMSGVGPGGIFYEKGWMDMTKIKGNEQMVEDVDHQNLENIMSKAWQTKMCYNTGGRMVITEIGAQQNKMDNEGHLGRAMREVSLEEMCFSGVGSIGTKRVEEQQLGMGSSVTPISIDSLIIEPKTYNDKEMVWDRSGKRKRKVYKTKEKEMEKKMKDKIKNRESASRSRARKEAYRMDLEWRVNQLNNENTRLKRDLEELRTETLQKPMDKQENTNDGKTDHACRRCNSCPF
ncbi:ABSCISIC ACID-INSENSITIVE 5-like protein 5 [Phoenix dactylifera]|uniref:ABSCISIC ACID-INSENSITIVE 5-like protein 5 n=1 Tax=Phoenix dactylifera TaxID=42345 RepID=A0A8B8ZBH2_PHODC|nr:ABSCISIC ACID-INSENSITIVE 5-like protein 5 [Phoenix dactylifera]